LEELIFKIGGFIGMAIFWVGPLVALGLGIMSWVKCDYRKSPKFPSVGKFVLIAAMICFISGVLFYTVEMAILNYHASYYKFSYIDPYDGITVITDEGFEFFELRSYCRPVLMQGAFYTAVYLFIFSISLIKYDISRIKYKNNICIGTQESE
jgi:hypothetical protein